MVTAGGESSPPFFVARGIPSRYVGRMKRTDAEIISRHMKNLGSKGGTETARRLTARERRERARKAGLASAAKRSAEAAKNPA